MIQLLNVDRLAQGKTEIRIGIGIASGQVIAGYTGTTRRATYTCVGDTVNLAARLESHTKVVGKPILIDDATQSCPGQWHKDRRRRSLPAQRQNRGSAGFLRAL